MLSLVISISSGQFTFLFFLTVTSFGVDTYDKESNNAKANVNQLLMALFKAEKTLEEKAL